MRARQGTWVLVLGVMLALCGVAGAAEDTSELEAKLSFTQSRRALALHKRAVEEAERAYYRALVQADTEYVESLEAVRKDAMAKDVLEEAQRIVAIQDQVRQEIKELGESLKNVGKPKAKPMPQPVALDDHHAPSKVDRAEIYWLTRVTWLDPETKRVYVFKPNGIMERFEDGRKDEKYNYCWRYDRERHFKFRPMASSVWQGLKLSPDGQTITFELTGTVCKAQK